MTDGGLWVWAEEREGKFEPSTFELLGKARELADNLGARVTALWLTAAGSPAAGDPRPGGGSASARAHGKEDPQRLVASGADRVVKVASPHVAPQRLGILARAALQFLEDKKPDAMLLADTPFHRALASRLASKLETGCVCGVTSIDLDTMERQLVFAVRAYDGRITEQYAVRTKPAIALVEAHAFRAPSPEESRYGSTEEGATDAREEHSRIKPQGRVKGARLIDTVVCLGGALPEKEVPRARELAQRLGAKVVGDRHAHEMGFVKDDEVVGLGHRRERAKLWIALGTWGSLDHLEAVQADTMVAAHPDANAPVMRRAQFGIVGDLGKSLDGLLGSVR